MLLKTDEVKEDKEDHDTIYLIPPVGDVIKSWLVYSMMMLTGAVLLGSSVNWATVILIIIPKIAVHSADCMFGIKRRLPVRMWRTERR